MSSLRFDRLFSLKARRKLQPSGPSRISINFCQRCKNSTRRSGWWTFSFFYKKLSNCVSCDNCGSLHQDVFSSQNRLACYGILNPGSQLCSRTSFFSSLLLHKFIFNDPRLLFKNIVMLSERSVWDGYGFFSNTQIFVTNGCPVSILTVGLLVVSMSKKCFPFLFLSFTYRRSFIGMTIRTVHGFLIRIFQKSIDKSRGSGISGFADCLLVAVLTLFHFHSL